VALSHGVLKVLSRIFESGGGSNTTFTSHASFNMSENNKKRSSDTPAMQRKKPKMMLDLTSAPTGARSYPGFPRPVDDADLTEELVNTRVNEVLVSRCFSCQVHGIPTSNSLSGRGWQLSICQPCCKIVFNAVRDKHAFTLSRIFLLAESEVKLCAFKIEKLVQSASKSAIRERGFVAFLRCKHAKLVPKIEIEAIRALQGGVSLGRMNGSVLG